METNAEKETSAENDSFTARNKKIFKWVHQVCPSYLPLCMLKDVIGAFRPFLDTWLLAAAIGGLAEGMPERQLFGIVLLIIGTNLVLSLIQWALDKLLIIRRRRVSDGVDAAMTVKAMTLDYQVMEKAETQKMFTRLQEGMNYSGGLTNYCACVSISVCAAFSAVYAVVLLIPLFAKRGNQEAGGMSAFVGSGWGMLLFVAVLALNVLALSKQNQSIEKIAMKKMERALSGNRVFGYFFDSMSNYAQGKAIRVYHMLPLYRSLWDKYRKGQYEIWIEGEKDSCRVLYLGTAASVATLFFLYVFLGIRVFSGLLTVGELTFYVATATALTGYLNTVMNLNAYMQMTSGYIVLMADFLELANEKYDGTIPIEKRLDNEYELEFRNVSFHYPNSEELALDHVSMKIRVGGKLAIVGPNGSGKSTFIKLLCRLYDPTEGEILLNGIDIRKYDYDEYRMIFSVVFQDFRLFSFSIAQNVAAGKDYDATRVLKCLEQAGLGPRMREMEHGIEELIYQQNDQSGVEISGGEAQKIAIARALYKDAPVVILDEPTAALDPVSEQEIYRRFDEMVEEKTAIYISHRMSSCRFCQQILVFDGGKIVQIGGHETLVREEEGLYAQLWNAQAQYYND
ncbi:MAG: ABC transporter ATP-binding protein/permease [Lachnospiraceae bacterium]|nr:ABC transporter ATP-binding protein/permease [Lachnospiraceae bacterium]